jgi:hypothetical protein
MNWKTYATAAGRAYIGIQLGGLLLGGIVASVVAQMEDSLLGSLSWAPGAMFLGAILTFIPTIVYAALLPAVVSVVCRRTCSLTTLFLVTSAMTALFFAVSALAFGQRKADMDSMTLAMFLCAFPPGWFGTQIVRKRIAQPERPGYGSQARRT